MNFIRQAFRVFVSVSLAISVFASILHTLLFFTPGVVEPGYSRFECPSMFEMSSINKKQAAKFENAVNSYYKVYDVEGAVFDPIPSAEQYKQIVENAPETLKKIESDPAFKNEKNYRAYICKNDTESTVAYFSPNTVIIAWVVTFVLLALWLLSMWRFKKGNRSVDIRSRYIMETASVLVFALVVYGSFVSIVSSTNYSDEKSCRISDINMNVKDVPQVVEFKFTLVQYIEPNLASRSSYMLGNEDVPQQDIDRAIEIKESVKPEAKAIVEKIKNEPGYKDAIAFDEKGGLDCQSYARQSAIAFWAAIFTFGFRWVFIHIAYRRRRGRDKKVDENVQSSSS